ncbi:MAG: DUF4386 domain-containing protein [Candidatus Methanoperedens sp.]|nr:DUF4386 domain-containing protein [Candidatus Methanoperedens sp.]
MNSNGKTASIDDVSQQKIARIAGLAFLFIVIGYTLTWIFVYSKLIVAGNAQATANNIMANESLSRIGIAGDLMIAISSLVLAWALYILLKPVNKNLALLALYLKLTDAILATVTVSFSFISLQILNGEAYLTVFKPEQLQYLVGLFLNMHTSASTIPMVFTGLGFIVFFYLLFKSNYVPRILASFGIFSYLSLLTYVFVKILVAQPATDLLSNIELIFYLPSVLFELIIGFWLLIKGVNVQEKEGYS